ncbi:vitamin K-dependent gamma-carboxylase-like protein [Kribbella steppae]|uniref:Vitamin K-dependent gamma-carboxylase-like protein n=1 Tax=Kribbella steppae TaxID=2512223 RepID=A0A4R2HWK2_9ACTN|nr:HTTM domain-containing protein [Kribbella steppae]TCO35469.1 vitamin K-dependent gamma-carboxylase-like protein [Kribbella steppae]
MSAIDAAAPVRRSLPARVAGWFTPTIALARVAWLRTVLYLFVILDMHAFVRDTRLKGEHSGLYQPLLLARIFELPEPSVANTTTLYVVLIVACLLGATNYFPRIAGWIVAPAFTWWVLIGMSDGKVDHDHLALVVALWVLPTVKAGKRGLASYGDQTRSEAAGWAVRCVQISVIATYFLSAVAKLRSAGWALTWPGSAVLTWAIVRRPHPVGEWLLHHPWMLHVMQWVGIIAEILSPVILWLKGRWQLLGALFFLGFHAANTAILLIHFLPTVVCWLAFAPLERIVPWFKRRRESGRDSDGDAGEAEDQAEEGRQAKEQAGA